MVDLRELRKSKGLTQKELGAILACHNSRISMVETGDIEITDSMVSRLHLVKELPDNNHIVKTKKNITIYNASVKSKNFLIDYKDNHMSKSYANILDVLIDSYLKGNN